MSYLERYLSQTAGLKFLGYWNAATNTPQLSSGSGTNGYYVVSVPGTTNLDGETDWQEKDWVVFGGTSWRKIDNTDKTDQIIGIESDNFTLSYNPNQTLASVTFFTSPQLTVKLAMVTLEYNSAQYPTKETWKYYGPDGTTVLETVVYTNTWANGALSARVKS